MRSWQVVMIQRLIGDKHRVTYLIDNSERHTVMVDATFGLEKALTDTGVMLAKLPPRVRAKIGSKENQ